MYIIYYAGDFSVYTSLAKVNQQDCVKPIYIGKAAPKGGRTGIAGAQDAGQELYTRLNEHAESVRAATNLALKDFSCRFLIIEHLFITLAEHTLINIYKPLWNYYGGFGNHDPGSGRYNQKRSPWDTCTSRSFMVSEIAAEQV